MKGGILGVVTFKTLSLICTVILFTMAAVAMFGEARARSLGSTVAVVGGDASNIVVVDMIPTFFDHLAGDEVPAKSKKG